MTDNSKIIKKRSKVGGRRAGAGRKPGSPNKLTYALKKDAAKYGPEVIKKLIQIIRDSETPVNVTVAACRELLDRGFGRPAIHIEQEINTRIIPWDELRKISEESFAKAKERHKSVIEGRAERLGIKLDHLSDPINVN